MQPTPAYKWAEYAAGLAQTNLWDPNWAKTPERIEKAMGEFLYGHSPEAQAELLSFREKVFPSTHTSLVMVQDIHATGLCPHHLLPVFYQVAVGYVPRSKVVGLSKLARVTTILCSRAVLQEEVASDICTTLDELLATRGTICVVVGFHSCMSARGIQARTATTTTAHVTGIFLDNDADIKGEFYRLLHPTTGGFPW